MKPKTLFSLILLAAIIASAVWFTRDAPPQKAETSEPVAFYQSPMHPWIKSDQPGNCTICGMALVPVYKNSGELSTAANDHIKLSPSSVNVLNVRTEPVLRQPLRRTLRVAGTIDDDDSRHRVLSAYVDGRIDKLFVNYLGAEVQEGQPLASMYSPALLTARREYLATARSGGSPALLALAKSRLQQLGLTDAQITSLPQKNEGDLQTEIIAPMSGTVVARGVYEGQYVKEGERLFEIGDFSTMWFRFDVYERDLAWIRVGQKLQITTPAAPGEVFEAQITFIDPNIDPATRTAKVRADVPNPKVKEGETPRRMLQHRLYAEATVALETPEVLAVPRSAVLAGGRQTIAYVEASAGHYEPRRVQTGRAGDDVWEIVEGLREGERVVTNGNLLIDSQAQISGAPEIPAAPAEVRTELGEAVTRFIEVAARMSSALASDDVAKFNQHAAEFRALPPTHVGADHQPHDDLTDAPDLAAARKSFLPISEAAAAMAKDLRSRGQTTVRVYECPMAQEGTGGTGAASWVQLAGPMRNPFFGAAMLDCGAEVEL